MAYVFLLSLMFSFGLGAMERQNTENVTPDNVSVKELVRSKSLTIDTSMIESETVVDKPTTPTAGRHNKAHRDWSLGVGVALAGLRVSLDAHCNDDKDVTSSK